MREEIHIKSPEKIPEKEEIEPKDVFGQEIDEVKRKIRENRELDSTEGEGFLSSLLKADTLEDFSKKKPESFKETLNALKDADPKVQTEIWKEELKTNDKELARDYINYYNLSQVAKLEELNPSPELKKFADKIISSNHLLDFETLKELTYLKPNAEQMKILERMAEMSINSRFPEEFSRALVIGLIRSAGLAGFPLDKDPEPFNIFLDEDKFQESKKNLREIEKKLEERGIGLESDFLFSAEFSKQKEEILWGIGSIEQILEDYKLPKYIGSSFLNFLALPIEVKKTILSDDFKKKVKDLNLEVKFSDLGSICEKKDDISKKEKAIKKIISDLKIEKIGWFDFENILLLSKGILNKISKRDFSSLTPEVREKITKPSPVYKEIASKFIENIRKTRGNYQARTFPPELLKYISSSLVFSYLALEKPGEKILAKLKEKNPEIHKKILQKDFHLEDIIPGKKATKRLVEKGNLEYLAAAQVLEIPLDLYGVIAKDLEGIKSGVDEKAEEIIEDYSQNKEEYLPYISSLLGYGARYKEAVNKILKLNGDKLWKHKFDHLPNDLKAIIDGIKDIKLPIEREIEKEDVSIYLKNLEEHLQFEKFSTAKVRIGLMNEEKIRNRAEGLINKAERVIALLKIKEIPEKKDIDNLLSNKAIFEDLGLGLTLGSIRETFQNLTKKEKGEVFLKSVEIMKEPAESLAGMDMKPSCMGAGGEWDFGALTAAQSLILILAPKDIFGKPAGESLLIPVKDEAERWRFELKDTYGAGGDYVKKFAKELEKNLREKNKDYYQGVEEIITTKILEGTLPKSKKLPGLENLKFYRDGKGEVELEEVELKSK